MFKSVVFFSESGIVGKVPRDFPNARNDIAWSIMMNADWCPYGKQPTQKYELGIITIPKTKPDLDIDFTINFKAVSLFFIIGAKPPSSPTEVE